MPSLADKSAFLPAVLADPTFQKDGVLFGTDPQVETDCQWVVVDPNRHRMAVWKKPYVTADFVETAKSLKASVFTNGTLQHSRYDGSGKVAAGLGYVGAEAHKGLARAGLSIEFAGANAFKWGFMKAAGPFLQVAGSLSGSDVERSANAWVDRKFAQTEATQKRLSDDDIEMRWFVAGPYGRVIGQDKATPATARAGLQIDDIVSPVDPSLGYFGRKAGNGFDCYEIDKGEPGGSLVEAAGGLYAPALLKSVATPDSFASNMWIYWALAPLKPSPQDMARLAAPLTSYMKVTQKPLSGLIVGMYHKGKGAAVQRLADIGCSDAIKLDGGDSALLGHDSTVLIGTGMSSHKRTWLQYGIAFFPI